MGHDLSSIIKILRFKSLINIVDIGANPIDGDPPYKSLLEKGLAHITGFEPNPVALEQLNLKKGSNETYLPNAVFDGDEHELKICNAQGMSSLLEPNKELLSYFHGFPDWGEVTDRVTVSTVRLDDIISIKDLDYLKIDIQGGELEVFRNGIEKLRDCLVIQTEVEFLPMYKDQPLFSEVELFLRGQGFIFHRFAPLISRTVQPLVVEGDIYKGLSQNFWADAVFIKDFTKFDNLSPLELKKIALILHEVYGSVDIALRAIMAIDKKSKSNMAEEYITAIS
jgi:FkbM family methyltransferase